MSGNFEKKVKKQKDQFFFYLNLIVLVLSAISILLYFFLSESMTAFIIKSAFFSLLNYACLKLLDYFYESMFFNYIMDTLIINLAVMVFINYHVKAYAIYLLIPFYFAFKGFNWMFQSVKDLDKEQNEPDSTESNNKDKKSKKKY